MTATTKRIPPLDPVQFTDEQADVAGGRDSARSGLNIVRLLVQNPALYRSYFNFAMHLVAASSLSLRDRELVILHACSFCGDTYDVAQHRSIAKKAGLNAAEIAAAINDGAGLADFERTLLTATEELIKGHRIADATYSALAERYSNQQLLDLVFTVGNYSLMSMVTNSFDVRVESDNTESNWKPY